MVFTSDSYSQAGNPGLVDGHDSKASESAGCQQRQRLKISVVIPTCNRKQRLLSLLSNLENALYRPLEVIIVDSGEDTVEASELSIFENLSIVYLRSEKSVCIQRNIGIRHAAGEWVFLCDDDIEVPQSYLQQVARHIHTYPDAGAVSGLVLQKQNGNWTSSYPIGSARQLIWKFIFQQSVWGEIKCPNNFLVRQVKKVYTQKGNYISKAGWPVVTDFSGDYFECPVYGLGASVVRRQWLLQSLYAEVLDRHGIGDNYGVAINFPRPIHVLPHTFVYHHQESLNRLERSSQYFRRVLALDYFRRTNPRLHYVKKTWLLWSLTGNLLEFIFVWDRVMIKAVLKAIWNIALGSNPYSAAAKENRKVVQP